MIGTPGTFLRVMLGDVLEGPEWVLTEFFASSPDHLLQRYRRGAS